MPIKIVKVNAQRSNFTRYIGRQMMDGWGGTGLPKSVFHNPFRIGKDGTRGEVLLKFAEYWYAPEQKELRRQALYQFDENEILGCWCHPLDCHGDIIAAYVHWKRQENPLCLLIP